MTDQLPTKPTVFNNFQVGIRDHRMQIIRLHHDCIPDMQVMEHEDVEREFGADITTKLQPHYRIDGDKKTCKTFREFAKIGDSAGYDDVSLQLYNELLAAIAVADEAIPIDKVDNSSKKD